MSKTTTVAIYVSDRDKILGWMRGGETFREKIHELILNEEKRMKGGKNNNVRKEETSEEG